jgi:hypothetical protein
VVLGKIFLSVYALVALWQPRLSFARRRADAREANAQRREDWDAAAREQREG